MNIEELIKRYLIAYDGRLNSALQKVKEDIVNKVARNKQCEYINMVDIVFEKMISDNVVKLVLYEKMTPEQKIIFNKDNEPIYEIYNK